MKMIKILKGKDNNKSSYFLFLQFTSFNRPAVKSYRFLVTKFRQWVTEW
jgi:hypothetical protein